MDRTPDFLKALADLSARLGAEIALVQAAGGNTSLKTADTVWIKASGTWLAEALTRPIFVPLDRQALAVAVNGPPGDIDAGVERARRGEGGLLPSIETSLHALMPHRVVVHVHGVNTLAHAMLRDGRERAAARLAGLPFTWVPYIRPGAPLTVLVREALARAPADILILENHGPVVGADTEAAAERLMREVEARLALPPRPVPTPDLAQLAGLAAASGCNCRAAPKPMRRRWILMPWRSRRVAPSTPIMWSFSAAHRNMPSRPLICPTGSARGGRAARPIHPSSSCRASASWRGGT